LRAPFTRASTTQASPFALTHAAPNTELLAVVEGVLETVLASHTTATDFFGFARRCSTFGEKEVRIDAHAVGSGLPATIFHSAHQFHDFHVAFLPLRDIRHGCNYNGVIVAGFARKSKWKL
jgi:hypothetical protein